MLQEKLNELFMDRSLSHREGMTEEEVNRLDAVKNRGDQIYKALREILPESSQNLLIEFDEIIGEEKFLLMEAIYRVGLKDGIELAEGVRVTCLNNTLKVDSSVSPRPSNFKEKQFAKRVCR